MTLQWDHWPFVAGAYGVFLVVAAWLAVGASLRLGRSRRRLRAVDPRAGENAS